jgi:hypothetical protein
MVDSKIVRAKSKFKAAPERPGTGAAPYPICTVSQDRRRGAEPVAEVFAEPTLTRLAPTKYFRLKIIEAKVQHMV